VILLLFVHYVAKFSPWCHQPCFSVGSHLVLWPTRPWSPDFGNCNFLHYKKCFSWHCGRLLWNHSISELIIMKVFSTPPVEFSCVSSVVSFGYVWLTWLRVLNSFWFHWCMWAHSPTTVLICLQQGGGSIEGGTVVIKLYSSSLLSFLYMFFSLTFF
jgi:hypothetical protein